MTLDAMMVVAWLGGGDDSTAHWLMIAHRTDEG